MPIALVDCNSFYAACEALFRPGLRGRPIAVLSNNDGCVVALNAAAKAAGLVRTMPYFQARPAIERHGVAVFSSNYCLYADISQRVREVYRGFSPEIEDYSIDESFLVFPEGSAPPAAEIIRRVAAWTGIAVSVGVGPTKTLAKLANRLAKRRPEGHFAVDESNRLACLADFPAAEVWGIGPAHARSLAAWGIRSAAELAAADPALLRRRLTVTGLKTQLELQGRPQIDLEPEPADKRNILSSRSFAHPVESLLELSEAAAEYARLAAEKLRAQDCRAAAVLVHLTTDYWRPELPQHSQSCLVRLPRSSAYVPDLVGAAQRGLREAYREGFAYKKLGVTLMELERAGAAQGDLFVAEEPKLEGLMREVERLNARYGRDSLLCGPRRAEADWMMRRDKVSPRYTTRWDELATVRADDGPAPLTP